MMPDSCTDDVATTTARARILVVDDDADLRELLIEQLALEGYRVDGAEDSANCLAMLRRTSYHAVIADVLLGQDDSGISLCKAISAELPDLPVIVATGSTDTESAAAAARAGAYDFVRKPLTIGPLLLAVARAVAHKRLCEEVQRLQLAAAPELEGGLVGESPLMRAVLRHVDRVSASDVSVLLSGERGTGKNLIARTIHYRSGRRAGPFMAVACAGVPPAVLKRELFGSGDDSTSDTGALVRATGGTLFLEDVGHLSADIQLGLLRALQDRCVHPGSAAPISFDARLITATPHSLERAIERGEFDEELFRWIAVEAISVPPLRARGHDVLLIAQRELTRLSAASTRDVRELSPQAAHILLEYDWPGNVRELQSCIEHAVALCRSSEIHPDDLSARVRDYGSTWFVLEPGDPSELPTLGEMQRRYIHRVLDAVAGNKSRASRVLGVDRRTLYRKLEHGAYTGMPR